MPLWSVHPTGCKGPAGSAHSSQHYLLLILIPCTGVLWHPWERWTCTGRRRLGRREQGEGCCPRNFLPCHIPTRPMVMLSVHVFCPQSGSRHVLFHEWTTPALSSCKPQATCTLRALVRQIFQTQVPAPPPTASPHLA